MSEIVEKLWPYAKICAFIAIALIVGGSFFELNIYVFGIFVLASWLLFPLVSYWLTGNHNWPVSFMVKAYPMFVRKFTVFGWFLLCLILSYVWVTAFIQFKFR